MMQVFTETKWDGLQVKIQAEKVLNVSMFELGLIVEGQAKDLAPVDTGRLAASITTQAQGKGTKPSGQGAKAGDIIQKPNSQNQVLVGTPVEYAPFMEFGTIFTDAQPFLRPALDLAKGKKLTVVEKNGKKYLKNYLISKAEYDARVTEYRSNK